MEAQGIVQRAVGASLLTGARRWKIREDPVEKTVEIQGGPGARLNVRRSSAGPGRGGRVRVWGSRLSGPRPSSRDAESRTTVGSSFVRVSRDGAAAAEAGVQRGDSASSFNRTEVKTW